MRCLDYFLFVLLGLSISLTASDGVHAQSVSAQSSALKSAKRAMKPKRLTMLDGRNIFMQHCMQCHLADHQTAPQLANETDWSWRIQSGVDFLVRATIAGKPYEEPLPNGWFGDAVSDRYKLDNVETVVMPNTPVRERGCELPRGGCKACNDAEIIAVVKYMVQAAVQDNANYVLW